MSNVFNSTHEDNQQQEYLDTCRQYELKSLEVSKAEKALNALRQEKDALLVKRDNQRRVLMGDQPQTQQSKSSGMGTRGRGF